MTPQRSVLLATALGAAALLAGSSVAADRVVVRPLRVLPVPELARPWLIDTTSCLELSSAPFALCLIAVGRCSPEWRVVPLRSFEPARAEH
jgi:hypothetical protein